MKKVGMIWCYGAERVRCERLPLHSPKLFDMRLLLESEVQALWTQYYRLEKIQSSSSPVNEINSLP